MKTKRALPFFGYWLFRIWAENVMEFWRMGLLALSLELYGVRIRRAPYKETDKKKLLSLAGTGTDGPTRHTARGQRT